MEEQTAAESVKGPLWQRGDGLVPLIRAETTWMRDHPTFRLGWALCGFVGVATTGGVDRLVGINFWVLPLTFTVAATASCQLWLRAQLQRAYTPRPWPQRQGSWW